MSDEFEPIITDEENSQEISHDRILKILVGVVIAGTVLIAIFYNLKFSIGFFIGGSLSVLNYFWLKSSLKKVFDSVGAGGKPHLSATKYFLRYAFFGGFLIFLFLTKWLPVTAVILGLASFAFAVLFEALIRIFTIFFNKKEL